MPAKSKAQQMAAGAALAAKRGEAKVSDLKGAAREMYDSMSESELEDFAETERKNLPGTSTTTRAAHSGRRPPPSDCAPTGSAGVLGMRDVDTPVPARYRPYKKTSWAKLRPGLLLQYMDSPRLRSGHTRRSLIVGVAIDRARWDGGKLDASVHFLRSTATTPVTAISPSGRGRDPSSTAPSRAGSSWRPRTVLPSSGRRAFGPARPGSPRRTRRSSAATASPSMPSTRSSLTSRSAGMAQSTARCVGAWRRCSPSAATTSSMGVDRTLDTVVPRLVPGERIEVMAEIVAPLIRTVLGGIAGVQLGEDVPLDSISIVFDRLIGTRKRQKIEQALRRVADGLRAAPGWDKSDEEEAGVLALFVLGNDALRERSAKASTSCSGTEPGRRFSDIDYPEIPTETGVPYVERIAEEAFEQGGQRFEPGARIRVYLQAFAYAEEADAADIFGVGAHSCLGKPLSIDVWRRLTARLCGPAAPCRGRRPRHARRRLSLQCPIAGCCQDMGMTFQEARANGRRRDPVRLGGERTTSASPAPSPIRRRTSSSRTSSSTALPRWKSAWRSRSGRTSRSTSATSSPTPPSTSSPGTSGGAPRGNDRRGRRVPPRLQHRQGRLACPARGRAPPDATASSRSCSTSGPDCRRRPRPGSTRSPPSAASRAGPSPNSSGRNSTAASTSTRTGVAPAATSG